MGYEDELRQQATMNLLSAMSPLHIEISFWCSFIYLKWLVEGNTIVEI